MLFFVEAALVLVAVLVIGQLSRRVGQPAVLGQLLVGVLLGPALLGVIQPNDIIKHLAEIGVVLLMFMAGLETDFNDIKKTAVAATFVAFLGVAFPFAGGAGLGFAWGYSVPTAVFIGTLLVATSVSISAQTLRELGQLSSCAGVTVLAAAVLDDILGIIVLSLVLGAFGGGAAAAGGGIGLLLGKMALFFVVAILVGWKVLPPVIRIAAEAPHEKTALVTAGIVTALVFAYLAELAGLAGIIGSYLAGLMLSMTEFKEKLLHETEHTAFSFFVPFFFTNVGLSATFAGLTGQFWLFALTLTLIAVVTKLIGGGLGALLGGLRGQAALGVGTGMVARGEVGLIMATLGLERGLITPELYTGAVLVCLLTTLVTPLLLKSVFQRGATPAG